MYYTKSPIVSVSERKLSSPDNNSRWEEFSPIHDKVNVAFLSFEEASNACPTIRILSPFQRLQKKISLKLPTGKKEGKSHVDLRRLYLADVILVQRASFLGTGSIKKLKGPHQKVIYDIDDLLTNIPKSILNRQINKDRWKIIDLIKNSDAVTVSTERLKKHFMDYNKNIYVIPNYIDPLIWHPERRREVRPEEPIIIGYMGTPTHQEDLKIIAPAIRRILREFRHKIVFRFFGCVTDDLMSIEGTEFSQELIRDYKSFARYLMAQKIDIALAPLQDNEFNRCKSNIKFLEYSMCKIPGIYSRIVPYTKCIKDGVTGILCDYNMESWYVAIRRLIEDPHLRKQIAENAHLEVVNHYLLTEKKAERWHEIVGSLSKQKLSKIRISKTSKNYYTMKISYSAQREKTIHSLYDPQSEAATMVSRFQAGKRDLLIVLGVGLGYHVKALKEKYAQSRILVVEADPRVFSCALRYGVISKLKKNIDYIVGYPPSEAIKEITSFQVKAGMPPINVFSLSSEVSALPDYYQPILESLKRAARLRLSDKLRYSKFKNHKTKAILFDFEYFLSHEVKRALFKTGVESLSIRGDKREGPRSIFGKLTKAILDFRPDFILTINHFGFDEEGVLAEFLESIEMPTASWFVDSPNLIVKPFNRNASPYVSLFLWDRSFITSMRETGFEHVNYLPLATDEEIFKPVKLGKTTLKKYRALVGFVGSSMLKPFVEKLNKLPTVIHPIVEKMANTVHLKQKTFEEALECLTERERLAVESLEIQQRINFEAAVLWKATLIYRVSCIKQLAKFNAVIHGDKQWSELLGPPFRLKPCLRYYDELPLFYNCCTVNFNTTSRQMSDAVNQRVFDVPACGSFLITDYQESIEELFNLGTEVVTYRTSQEIPELVKFYLKRPMIRKKIAREAKKRVLREHTYKHRIEYIARVMKKRYG